VPRFALLRASVYHGVSWLLLGLLRKAGGIAPAGYPIAVYVTSSATATQNDLLQAARVLTGAPAHRPRVAHARVTCAGAAIAAMVAAVGMVDGLELGVRAIAGVLGTNTPAITNFHADLP